MGAKNSRSAPAVPAAAAQAIKAPTGIVTIESNELVAAPTSRTAPADDERALSTGDQCLLGLSDVCAQLLLEEALSAELLRAALAEALAAVPWFAGRLVLRQSGAFDVSCCNSGARLVIAATSASLQQVEADITPPKPPLRSRAAAATATAAAATAADGAATAAAATAAAAAGGFAACPGDRSGMAGGSGANPWVWQEFAMPRDPMAIVQDKLPLASVYLLHLRGGGCVLTLTAYHGMADFESLQTFAAHLSAAYNRQLQLTGEERAQKPPAAAPPLTEAPAPPPGLSVEQRNQQQRGQKQEVVVAVASTAAAVAGPAAAAATAAPHAPPGVLVEVQVASRSGSAADLLLQPPQQPVLQPQLPLQLLQPPEARRSPRYDPGALEALAAAELPPGVPPRERTFAPSAAELGEAMQRMTHEVAVRGGGKERRLFHVPAARVAELKAQATAELAQERERATAAAAAAAADPSGGDDEERQQLQMLRDVEFVSTKDAFVARLLQLLHSVPLRRGTPLTLLQAADMRRRVVDDLRAPAAAAAAATEVGAGAATTEVVAATEVAERAAATEVVAAGASVRASAPSAAPAVESAVGGSGGHGAPTQQPHRGVPQPLPVSQLGNVLGTARVDGLRASEQSLGWAAGLLRHSLTRYAPAQYRRKLYDDVQLVAAHGGRGLMYEFVLERRLQYNLTAVEGPVLVSCWEVEYELWRFGGQRPRVFRGLGDSSTSTAIVVSCPPPHPDGDTAGGADKISSSSSSSSSSSDSKGAGGGGGGDGGGGRGGGGGGGLDVALTLHRAVWVQLDARWPPGADGGGGLAAAF